MSLAPDVNEIGASRLYKNTIEYFGQGAKTSQEQLDCDWTQVTYVTARQRKCRTDQVVRRFCSSGQKIQASLYWIIVIDWTGRTKYQVDRVKISTRPPPH